jgi:hypothetical protein
VLMFQILILYLGKILISEHWVQFVTKEIISFINIRSAPFDNIISWNQYPAKFLLETIYIIVKLEPRARIYVVPTIVPWSHLKFVFGS